MCFDLSNDSLRVADRDALTDAAPGFPAHSVTFRSNDDGMTWAVLQPRVVLGALPRITICRMDPCVMALVEDCHGRRQIRGLAAIEDALDFARSACEAAILAPDEAAKPALH